MEEQTEEISQKQTVTFHYGNNHLNFNRRVGQESDLWFDLYSAILDFNKNQNSTAELIPFGYPKDQGTITFDENESQEIATDLSIFIWYVTKAFDTTEFPENKSSNFDEVKKPLDKLFTPVYEKQIISDERIRWLCTQKKFYDSLKKINEYGNVESSPCRQTKIHALSALSMFLTSHDKNIEYKTPDYIDRKLPSSNKVKMIPLPPRETQSSTAEETPCIICAQKKSIWPKVFGIAACALIAGAAVAFTLFTCGIGTGILAGLGVIGKAILGFTAAYVGESIGLGVGIFGAGVYTCIHLGSELHDTIKHNKSIGNNGYTRIPSSEPQVPQNNNNDKMSLLYARFPNAQKESEKQSITSETPLLPNQQQI